MNLLLTRQIKTSEFTLGELFIDGKHFCYTVEDTEREGVKVYGKTAIPKGVYKVIVNISNKFKKFMPLLLDVPKFKGVRIHSGNTAEDTEGCIIVGINRTENGVKNSRIAFDLLMSELENQTEINLTIN